MTCEELMKRDVECLSPSDDAEEAARRMRDENIGFLPVCDQSRKVLGVVTDRDIAVRLVAEGRPADTEVEEFMTRDVVACAPRDDVQKALQSMSRNHKSRILCIDGGRLVGVISLSDMAERLRGDGAIEALREISSRETHA